MSSFRLNSTSHSDLASGQTAVSRVWLCLVTISFHLHREWKMIQKKELCLEHSHMMNMENQHRPSSYLWVEIDKNNKKFDLPLFCCHENVRVWHTVYFLLSSLRYPHHAQNPGHEVYRFVELRVLSNWGHVEYTCLYRFRVHGHISKWNSLITPYQQTFTVLSSLK